MSQLILCEVVHHVGLVLGNIQPLPDLIFLPIRVIDDPGIVAGRKIRGIEGFPGFLVEQTEFDPEIAHHAGIRRHALCIGADKVGENIFLISFAQVDRPEGDSEEFRHFPGAVQLLPVEELHGGAADLIILLLEQLRGEGAVHAAGHCYDNLFLF